MNSILNIYIGVNSCEKTLVKSLYVLSASNYVNKHSTLMMRWCRREKYTIN